MLGFILWAVAGVLFMGLGVFCFRAKKPMGFWANVKAPEVKDAKAYNRALGKMWCVFGGAFILLGLPLLMKKIGVGALISVLGTVFLILAMMAVYSQVIEPKYRK